MLFAFLFTATHLVNKENGRHGKIMRQYSRRLVSVITQFVILFGLWLILSGHFQVKYILIGALSAGAVTYLTNDLFYSSLQKGESAGAAIATIFLQIGRFILYIPWLIWQIVLANVGVALIILNPKMPIDPGFLLFSTKMKKNISRVTLANSITLTPGTVTVRLEEGEYIIHNLQPSLASGLTDGSMQNRVAKVYLEDEESPPEYRWVYSLEDL